MLKDINKKKPGPTGEKSERLKQQIITDLESKVFSGKLPGVTLLAKHYKSSSATLQRVLQELAMEDYVDIIPRSGTYVKETQDILFIYFVNKPCQLTNTPSAYFLAEYGNLYSGIFDALQKNGATLSFCQAYSLPHNFLKNRSRVIAIYSPLIQERVYHELANVNWIRVMGANDYNCPGGHITYDNYKIGKLAAEHLIKQNCKKFAFLGTNRTLLFSQRFESFADTLRHRDHHAMNWFVDVEEMNLAEIATTLRKYIKENQHSLASGELGIFCSADRFMVPLRQEFANAGLNNTLIKHISCDNNQYYLQGVYPKSTEIDIGMYKIGEHAAIQILGSIENIKNKFSITPILIEE